MSIRFVTFFALLLTFTFALPAQDAATAARGQQFQERLQKIKERLQLTPEQLEQVRPVLSDERDQLKAVRDKHADDQSRRGRLKMARELKAVQSATDDKLKKILSKSQMDELKKIRQETRDQFRERRRG